MRLRTANTVLAWLMVGVLLWPSQSLHSCCCAAHAAVTAPEVTPAESTAPASTTPASTAFLRHCCQKRAARLAASTKQTEAPQRVAPVSGTVQRQSPIHKQWQARCCCDEARSAVTQSVSPSRVRLLLNAPQELVTCSLFTAPRDIAYRELGDQFHSVSDPQLAPPDLSLLCRWLT